MRLIIHTEEKRIEIPEQCSISEFINEVNDIGLDFDEWEIGERVQTPLDRAARKYMDYMDSLGFDYNKDGTADIEVNYDFCTKSKQQ